MNAKKTKTMLVSIDLTSTKVSLKIYGDIIKQTDKYAYLGQTITSNGKCDDEILKRIEIARGAFNLMLKSITARHISMKTRKQIIKTHVWLTLLYGCETWTITTRNMTKLQSFEMWAYRKMMKISWREKKTNEEVLTLADEQLYKIPTIKKRKITYFGHMIRRNNIHRLLLEGPLEGKRSRGRPRTEWMTNITEWTGMRYEDLMRLAQDREPWRIMTANLLKEDSTWWWGCTAYVTFFNICIRFRFWNRYQMTIPESESKDDYGVWIKGLFKFLSCLWLILTEIGSESFTVADPLLVDSVVKTPIKWSALLVIQHTFR